AKSIFKRVDRLKAEQISAPKRERKVKITFPEPPHSGRVVLTATGLSKGYGGPLVFREVTFEVERGQRIVIMGLNGAGKTSLLRILAGQTEPNAGSFRLGHGGSLGYYAQEHEGIRAGVGRGGARPPPPGARRDPGGCGGPGAHAGAVGRGRAHAACAAGLVQPHWGYCAAGRRAPLSAGGGQQKSAA